MRRIYWTIALLMLSVAGLCILTLPTTAGFGPSLTARAAYRATHNSYWAHLSPPRGMGNVMDSSVALIPAAQVPLPGTTKIPAGEPRQPRQGLSSLPAAAQAVISATLGQNDARYQVRPKAGAQSRRADVPRASCPCSGMAKMAMAQSVGTLSAQNPAQGLQADFTPQGMEIHSGQTHWRLALASYGYGERLEKAEGAVPQSQGNRVEYRRGPLVEWYVNGPAGLEQGFTLATRPAIASSGTPDTGHRTSDSSPLTIALEIGGDLTATAESSAEAMGGARAQGLTLRDSHGQAVLRYTGLTAHDASGRALAAWLEVDRQELRLRVDDAVARYPEVVDPYIQQAKLTASDGVANAGFGFSLSVSNDGCEIVVGVESSEAAYVFVKPAGGWTNMTQVAEMTASDGTSSSRFGLARVPFKIQFRCIAMQMRLRHVMERLEHGVFQEAEIALDRV